MYAIIPQQIPQDRRAEINEKILFAIDSPVPITLIRTVLQINGRLLIS